MISVYYRTGDAQWKYDIDETEHDYIIKSLLEDKPDLEEMFEDSLEILRDISALDEDEMDEDDQIDQTVAVSFLWHYFNHLSPEEQRIQGDVALIEDEDGTGVSVVPASALEEIDDEDEDEA